MSARRTQICAATSFLALSRSNSPFSKPPIRPEFLLRTSAPLRRNKRHLGNSRLQQIKRPRRRWPLRGTDGSSPPPSSGESVSLRHPLSKVENPAFRAGCGTDLAPGSAETPRATSPRGCDRTVCCEAAIHDSDSKRMETADNRAHRTIQESRIADLKTTARSQAASILGADPFARSTRLRLHARQDGDRRRAILSTVATQAAAASAPFTTKWS